MSYILAILQYNLYNLRVMLGYPPIRQRCLSLQFTSIGLWVLQFTLSVYKHRFSLVSLVESIKLIEADRLIKVILR